MRDLRFLTQFAGTVPQPVAVYRVPGIGLSQIAAPTLGVAHFALGALAEFQQEHADLLRENDALVALGDAGGRLSQEQLDRLGAIGAKLPQLETNIATLEAARSHKRQAPTTDAIEIGRASCRERVYVLV